MLTALVAAVNLSGLAGGVAHDFNNILTVVVRASNAAREVVAPLIARLTAPMTIRGVSTAGRISAARELPDG